jgi:hypothetical protein
MPGDYTSGMAADEPGRWRAFRPAHAQRWLAGLSAPWCRAGED